MRKIRVLLAEDHETVRQGLRLLLETQPDLQVVGEVGDGEAAVNRAQELTPDVAVLDISMPKSNGLQAALGIRSSAPKTAIVMLTRYSDAAYVRELEAVGALGYVLKQSPSSELLRAIRAAARGERHLDPNISTRLRKARDSGAGRAVITERESEVLRLMALGNTNKGIAETLRIAVKTVEVHKTNAMRKLGFGGRIDVIHYAILQGWLKED